MGHWISDRQRWSLRLALGGGWAAAPTFVHPLPESFPLLRGHVFTTSFHATTEIRAAVTVPSQSAEEDTAQHQDPHPLPEGDLAPPEKRRQQPIPKVQHDFAADGDKCHHPQDRQRSNENHFPFSTHIQSLTFS